MYKGLALELGASILWEKVSCPAMKCPIARAAMMATMNWQAVNFNESGGSSRVFVASLSGSVSVSVISETEPVQPPAPAPACQAGSACLKRALTDKDLIDSQPKKQSTPRFKKNGQPGKNAMPRHHLTSIGTLTGC